MLVHRRVTPIIKFASTHLYSWVEKGTMRIKCLANEQIQDRAPTRARSLTARSGISVTSVITVSTCPDAKQLHNRSQPAYRGHFSLLLLACWPAVHWSISRRGILVHFPDKAKHSHDRYCDHEETSTDARDHCCHVVSECC